MSKGFFFVMILLTFFLDDNILSLIGYPHNDVTASSVFKIHPLAYFSIISLIFLMLSGKIKLSGLMEKCSTELQLLAFCGFTFLYLLFFARLESIAFIVDALITPAIVSILILHTKEKYIASGKNAIMAAFGINFLMAFYEKARNTPILTQFYLNQFPDFRATALYGHPLNNALLMSTMGIILYLYFEKLFYKLGVLIAVIVSLLCFGARGGIIGIVGGVAIGIVIDFFTKNLKTNFRNLTVAFFGIVAGLIILFNTSLGDRILHNTNFQKDNSAQERVRTLALLDKMAPRDLQFGMTESEIDVLMRKGGVHIMENYFVVWTARFGIYLAIVLLFMILKFAIKQIRAFDRLALLPVLFTVLFVASINNSLATKTRVLSVLVITCYAFKKQRTIALKKIEPAN